MTTRSLLSHMTVNLDRLPEGGLRAMRTVRLDSRTLRLHWFHPEVSIWLRPEQLDEMEALLRQARRELADHARSLGDHPDQLNLPFHTTLTTTESR